MKSFFCVTKRCLKRIAAIIKIVCRNAAMSIFQIPFAAILCFIKLNNKNTHYVVICDHIGDFLISMGYLEDMKKQKQIKHITVCITEKFLDVLPLYQSSYDSYKICRDKTLHYMLRLNATNFGIHILDKLPNITLINPANAFTDEFFDYIVHYPDLTLKNCIQYGCYHLNENAAFFAPQLDIEKKVEWKKIKGFQIGGSVLISPYARATCLESGDIFANLVRALKNEGFSVFTNLSSKKHIAVAGTQGVFLSMSEVLSFVENGGYVIGARSGLLDLLMYVKCKLVAIYSSQNKYFDFFSLEALPNTKAEILQIQQTENVKDDINKIIKFLKGEIIC